MMRSFLALPGNFGLRTLITHVDAYISQRFYDNIMTFLHKNTILAVIML